MGLRSNLQLLKQVAANSSERAQEATGLTEAIAERLREVLPAEEFQVHSDGRTLRVTGVGPRCGNGYSTAPWLLWSLPDEPARRLELLLQTIGRELQRFLANAQQSPWPAPGADAHVAVTDTTASLWWGGHDQQLAAIALRPIDRAALGL